MVVRVTTAARLHFGFRNLSLSNERLYGGIGLALSAPSLVVEAERSGRIETSHPVARSHAERAASILSVPGARLDVVEELPRHVGLGSGTQLALAVYVAIARSYDLEPAVRDHAPALGRGGRSGVGIATFERGGFVLDVGHPTELFTPTRPPDGEWRVPPVAAHHAVPSDWRVLLLRPDVPNGRSGEGEDASIRTVVERADPTIADEIDRIVVRQLLPALADADVRAFGRAVEHIGRRNGAWYEDAQGGIYRSPIDGIVSELGDEPAIDGLGQSSWGPTVYGITDRARTEAARHAAREALDRTGLTGSIELVSPRNDGARVERIDR